MQSLDVISVNFWQIVVSLANLLIIFLIVKKFLYKPVKKVLADRKKTMDDDYSAADKAKNQALSDKKAYEEKLSTARAEADGIIQSAANTAHSRENEILAEAMEKADRIVLNAQKDAELEMKKAEDGIKTEIVDVSTRLTEKLLEREITAEDHKKIIDSFIDGIGDENDGE